LNKLDKEAIVSQWKKSVHKQECLVLSRFESDYYLGKPELYLEDMKQLEWCETQLQDAQSKLNGSLWSKVLQLFS
jgi:hypothetical protein